MRMALGDGVRRNLTGPAETSFGVLLETYIDVQTAFMTRKVLTAFPRGFKMPDNFHSQAFLPQTRGRATVAEVNKVSEMAYPAFTPTVEQRALLSRLPGVLLAFEPYPLKSSAILDHSRSKNSETSLVRSSLLKRTRNCSRLIAPPLRGGPTIQGPRTVSY